jgi:NAD(P)-dependent dehydrogenase (short-subunit alcohol dehydrogenase family)
MVKDAGGRVVTAEVEARWQEMIDINLSGVWKTVKAGVPHILEGDRGGSIILPIPWVTAEEISNAVLFLASDEARYITGVALPVDAGSCLK